MDTMLLMFHYCYLILNLPISFDGFPTFTLLSVIKVTLVIGLGAYFIRLCVYDLHEK